MGSDHHPWRYARYQGGREKGSINAQSKLFKTKSRQCPGRAGQEQVPLEITHWDFQVSCSLRLSITLIDGRNVDSANMTLHYSLMPYVGILSSGVAATAQGPISVPAVKSR